MSAAIHSTRNPPTIATISPSGKRGDGVQAVSGGGETVQKCYPLPYEFPDGRVWAAIRRGEVVNMAYMTPPNGMHFGTFRQRERGRLALDGVVWSGEVKGGKFWPSFESTDVRRGGDLNTARVNG